MEDNVIYLGAKGSVVAIDRQNGKQRWRTALKGSGFVLVVLDRDLVFAHTRGELFALDAETGNMLWENGLEGLGYGYVTIASNSITPERVMPAIRQMMSQQAAASAGAAS